MSFSVLSALHWWSRECPDTPALIFEGADLTFGDLWGWTSNVASHLSEDLGVDKGDRVAMVAENSLEYAVLALSLLHLRAIGTPLSYRSTARELDGFREDLEPVAVFTDAARRDTACESFDRSAVKPLEGLQAFRDKPAQKGRPQSDADDPIFIIGTSGSTARPKGVIYTNRMVMSYAAEFALTEPRCAHGSKVLSMGPFSSTSGYLLLMQFLAMGATMYLEGKFVPERALSLLENEKITTLQAAPVFFERIAALDAFKTADLSLMQFGQIGGARVLPSLLEAWRSKGVILRQAYGCTEAGGAWAARDKAALNAPEKAGYGGLFTEYRIIRDDGSDADAGETGEILISGPSVTPGYWNNPEATSAAIKDGWLHTGDLGKVDTEGNLTFVDRKKDIIISGGLNVSALEVEAAISELPGIQEVAVISAPDDRFGETPMAIVYGDGARLEASKIIEHCDSVLSNYKVPRYIIIEEAPLPRLPSGKISKPELRRRYKDPHKALERVR